MLYGIKDLKPGMPTIDEQDIKNKRRASSKIYHPDKGNTQDEQPYNFLNLCAEKLTKPKLRQYYLEQLQFFVENCERLKYDDELCRDFIEDLNNKVITEEKLAPVIPFYRRL